MVRKGENDDTARVSKGLFFKVVKMWDYVLKKFNETVTVVKT